MMPRRLGLHATYGKQLMVEAVRSFNTGDDVNLKGLIDPSSC